MASNGTPIVHSPFTDKITKDVPKRGSSGVYDSTKNLPSGMPSRTTSEAGVPEKHFDTAATTKSPSLSGPITKSPFKDACGKK